MNPSSIIEQTAAHVRSLMSGDSSGHDWWHIQRVWRTAIYIAEREAVDTTIVQLAALLHDIGDWKFHGGDDSVGPRLAREWLASLQMDEATIANICDIIANLSFKGAGVDAPTLSPEGQVVQVADRLDAPDVKKGFILDGFPRNTAQAEALGAMLAGKGLKLDAVIEMKVDDEALVQRITGRYTCAKCGKGYHDRFEQPKVVGICDVCGSTEFIRRADDNENTVRDRLGIYNKLTAPLVEFYGGRGTLKTIDGMAGIADVTRQIEDVLRRV